MKKSKETLLSYKKQRNHTKSILRKDMRARQLEISRDCRDNPKRFWNYVYINSKSKRKEKIGDLIIVRDDTTEVANSDVLRAEV